MSTHFYPAVVTEIRDETPDAYTVFLQNPDPEKFSYLPGQYLTLKLEVEGEEIRRAFSLSSAPGLDEQLALTIKRVPGGKASNYLRDEVSVGDTIEVMPPMGHFSIEPSPDQSHHYIMMSGGSGITPLMSMLKSILYHEPLSKVSLWYGNRDRESIIFRDQLQDLLGQYKDRLHVYHTLSQPDEDWKGFAGRLDQERVYDLISDLFMVDEYRKRYYVCGPDGLMEGAIAALDKHAVFPSDVYREYYSAPVPSEEEVDAVYSQNGAAVSTENGQEQEDIQVQIHINGAAHDVSVSSKETILEAAIAAKVDPPYACQSGICVSCRAKVMRGEVSMDYDEGLSDEEKEAGYILTCQAHPKSAGVVVDFDE